MNFICRGSRAGYRRALGARRKHPIDRRKVAPRISQYLSVRGVIGILDGDDGAPQRRMLVTQILRELLFGLRGTDHQNFMHAVECARDFIKEVWIGGRLVAAMRALAAMHTLMLVASMDHGARLFGRGELPRGGLLMIDPNDCVKM